jgi:hypothetical protein
LFTNIQKMFIILQKILFLKKVYQGSAVLAPGLRCTCYLGPYIVRRDERLCQNLMGTRASKLSIDHGYHVWSGGGPTVVMRPRRRENRDLTRCDLDPRNNLLAASWTTVQVATYLRRKNQLPKRIWLRRFNRRLHGWRKL